MKKAASVLGRVFLGFILFLTLVPFYLLLSNSFKWSEEIVKKPFTLPAEWHFTNYAKSVVQVIHPMANTLLVIWVDTALKFPLSNRTWMTGTAKAENSAENGRMTNRVFSTVLPT